MATIEPFKVIKRLIAFPAMILAAILWDIPRLFVFGTDAAFDNPLFGRIIDWSEQ